MSAALVMTAMVVRCGPSFPVALATRWTMASDRPTGTMIASADHSKIRPMAAMPCTSWRPASINADENRVESTKKTMPIGMPMAIAGASWRSTTGQRRAVNASTGMPDSRKPLR